ncbi:DUF1360 domain-containing protein [Streptomyces sp. 35G-GA-8]|uniref:DUF1360 domain-containing protein n=1 Tax=Streptomyces sp. 35G-GA-8 TaxID=2939434 RepID=UPI00201EB5F2|nr:DUF1360 domain-containing protein [Streptomyces sp. 35G-GA-8]MCL7377471.1 DUF1360 domain-containing protein [Streptomyces sp. 35G-GA-8]
MDTLTLVLAALATARLTRLITADRITEAPRNWIIRRLPRESLLSYLLVCAWCSSIYVGAGMGVAWWAWGGDRWFAAATAALAFSYVTGWLSGRESGE